MIAKRRSEDKGDRAQNRKSAARSTWGIPGTNQGQPPAAGLTLEQIFMFGKLVNQNPQIFSQLWSVPEWASRSMESSLAGTSSAEQSESLEAVGARNGQKVELGVLRRRVNGGRWSA